MNPRIHQSMELARLFVEKYGNEIPADFADIFEHVCVIDSQVTPHTPDVLCALFSGLYFALETSKTYPQHHQMKVMRIICWLLGKRYINKADDRIEVDAIRATNELIAKLQGMAK